MKWWRKLPGWHRREAAFRDWYIGLLDRVQLATTPDYEQAVRVLKCPEDGDRLSRDPLSEDGRRPRHGGRPATAGKPKLDVTINPAITTSKTIGV